jgi:hypothetical protein
MTRGPNPVYHASPIRNPMHYMESDSESEAGGSPSKSVSPGTTSPQTTSEPVQDQRIFVRYVGVEGWDGTAEGRGDYEDAAKLKGLFAKYGECRFVHVHRESRVRPSPRVHCLAPAW